MIFYEGNPKANKKLSSVNTELNNITQVFPKGDINESVSTLENNNV